MADAIRENDDTEQSTADSTMIASLREDLVVEGAVRASLIALSGWEIGRELEVHGKAQVIGRSALVNTTVAAPSVSREHARIDLVEEDGTTSYTITDLGSSNGTRVNATRTSHAVLRNGDKIQMGDVVFKFVLQDEYDQQFHQNVYRGMHYDQLTGLLKMEAFRTRLEAMIRNGGSERFTLAMTDLDGLKRVNDTYGHLAGRMIVREMGAMMREAIRPGDIAALYGGDEAIVLFPDTELAAAAEVAERLRVMIAERVFELDGHAFQVSISQGLAEWPKHGQTADALIAAADRALYAAKAAGRNNVQRAAK